MKKLSRIFLEPVNTITHLVGALASLVGMLILLWLTRGDQPKMFSMLVYGVSMVLLYTASALLHGVRTSAVWRMRLNRVDHAAIFWLIAGTYTPIAFNIFPPPWRWPVLIAAWLLVALGTAYKLAGARIHGFLNTSVYVIFGWGSAAPLAFATNLLPLIPLYGYLLLLAGGLIYTSGFVVYYLQRPDPWPGVLGHHEIWHLFVLGGSLSHYLFILWVVVPFPRAVGG